ncbi:M48 family metallopeptidase [Catenovulum sediminis]|uniref:M48 family metallopeptidase n=1 Tax=Catenovulum sediminis TaxID=1740262 RepID=UPI00117F834A|nr:M48 family metallopeptidase [Catenovulum sediminis]
MTAYNQYNSNAEYKRWAIIISASIFVLLLFVYKAYTYILPSLSEYIADQLPASAAQHIGESALEQMDKEQFSESQISEEEQQRIFALFSKLQPLRKEGREGSENKEIQDSTETQYRLLFRQWDDTANAMALADGTIIITDRMLALIENDQQLAAILLHEIGHVEHNHVIENLVQMSVMSLAMAIAFGDASALNAILVQGAALGTLLSYSRKAEFEADQYAAQRMLSLYQTVEPFVQALKLLESDYLKQHQEDNASSDAENNLEETSREHLDWFSTHPNMESRVTAIRKVSSAQLN